MGRDASCDALVLKGFTEPLGVVARVGKRPFGWRRGIRRCQLRAQVKHPFRVIKRRFGHLKTRYRGLAKNRAAAEPPWTSAQRQPDKSVFATVRDRIVRTNGALSKKTAKLMAFMLVQAAAKTWRRLNGANRCQ